MGPSAGKPKIPVVCTSRQAQLPRTTSFKYPDHNNSMNCQYYPADYFGNNLLCLGSEKPSTKQITMAEARQPLALVHSSPTVEVIPPRDESAEVHPAPAVKRRKRDDTERTRVSRACDRCKRYERKSPHFTEKHLTNAFQEKRQGAAEINLAISVQLLV